MFQSFRALWLIAITVKAVFGESYNLFRPSFGDATLEQDDIQHNDT